jgi:hypothetical protein
MGATDSFFREACYFWSVIHAVETAQRRSLPKSGPSQNMTMNSQRNTGMARFLAVALVSAA